MTLAARIRVIVVDDQLLVRQGLITLLEEAETIDVVGDAADGEAAVALVDATSPDVVLMDLHMPVMDGAVATREIRRTHPDTRVLALTTFADDRTVQDALQAGAIGYLTKDTALDALISAIHAAADGHAVLDREVQARLLSAATSPPPSPEPSGGLPDGLTAREAEVLTLMAEGHTNAQIAAQLYVTEATVKTHINNLFAKTRLRNRAQAGAYVYRHGLGR